MKSKSYRSFLLIIFVFVNIIPSCKQLKQKKLFANFQYERFKDSVRHEIHEQNNDSTNIFDTNEFTPGVDSLDTLLIKIDTQWHRDAAMMEQLDTLISRLKRTDEITQEEKEKIKENIHILDSFLLNRNDTSQLECREKECPLYVAVNKSKQQLYLYIDGALKDSFLVSTGKKGYTTPDISGRPRGPVLMKYTSRKFPGGNYKGLGNMPYAVFVRGGYAIHGTTPGNFSKLGTVASHGCIRLHPDNGRIFYELVKLFGLENTWVSVRDSL